MNFKTPRKYAELCKVSDQAIYNRIEKGLIEIHELELPDGTLMKYIDADKYPPEQNGKQKPGPKPKPKVNPEEVY